MNIPNQSAPVERGFVVTRSSSGLSPSVCASVTVGGGQVCLNVPVVGNVCLPIPTWVPSGTAAQACIDVCTTWGFPTGACVTVTALGQQVARECFGKC